MKRIFFTLLGASLLVCDSTGGAPVPKELHRSKLYHPTVVGTKWTMKTDGREYTRIVSRVDDQNGVYTVAVGLTSGRGPASADVTERVSEKGVFRLFASAIIDVPDGFLPMIQTPIRQGESWETTVTTGKWKKTIAGEETVTVPAGKFTAVRIDWDRYNEEKHVASGSDWYVLGIGLVKQKVHTNTGRGFGRGFEHVSESEMQSFTPPDAAKRDK